MTKPFDPDELQARIQVGARVVDLQQALANRLSQLEQATSQIKQLHGILPICANCKKIRDGEGSWNQIEHYIQSHSDAEFSHGICPTCAKVLYPNNLDRIANTQAIDDGGGAEH